MRVIVIVKPGKKKTGIEVLENGMVIVSVSAHAIGGKANEAVRLALAKHFRVAPSCVMIKKGIHCRSKSVEILIKEI